MIRASLWESRQTLPAPAYKEFCVSSFKEPRMERFNKPKHVKQGLEKPGSRQSIAPNAAPRACEI